MNDNKVADILQVRHNQFCLSKSDDHASVGETKLLQNLDCAVQTNINVTFCICSNSLKCNRKDHEQKDVTDLVVVVLEHANTLKP